MLNYVPNVQILNLQEATKMHFKPYAKYMGWFLYMHIEDTVF